MDIHELLARLAYLARNSPATLTPAYLNASSRLERAGDASSRLELAWLMGQPGTDFQDRARARALLEEFLEAPTEGLGHVDLATLMLAELKQQDRRINALAKARADLVESQEEKQALEVQIETLTRLLETLQQQFEELKAIERDVK